jgi:hypothetical protein
LFKELSNSSRVITSGNQNIHVGDKLFDGYDQINSKIMNSIGENCETDKGKNQVDCGGIQRVIATVCHAKTDKIDFPFYDYIEHIKKL